MPELVVILGAGASYDCADEGVETYSEMQPPLVKDIFAARRSFAAILNGYPLAEMAAADIRLTLVEGAVPLEAYLRDQLRDSSDEYARLRYRQIPPYLQELLWAVSQPADGSPVVLNGYARQPANYDVLLNAALQLDTVLFVTLNYDTILDQRLARYPGGLADMRAYIQRGRNWALYKLHGSVDWGREVLQPFPGNYVSPLPREEYVAFLDSRPELSLDREIVKRGGGLASMRYSGSSVFYPALSAPLGSEDELSCPADHVSDLQRRLHAMGELNVLMIGYSGLDREVLRLLRESAAGVRSLMVANGDAREGSEAAQKVMGLWGGTDPSVSTVFGGGFSELVSSGTLRSYVEGLT